MRGLLRLLADAWMAGDGRAAGPVPHVPVTALTGLCVLCERRRKALRHGSAGAGP